MNEQNNHNGKEIISFIEKLSMITDGYQKQFYEKMLSDAKIVKCTSIYNILTENEIKKIKEGSDLCIIFEINHYGGIYYNQFIKNIDEKK